MSSRTSTRTRWPWVVLGLVGIGCVAVLLLGTGFVSALPSLVGGGARLRDLEVSQPDAVPYKGPRTNIGFDVSFPQCDIALPDTPGGFAIVGVHGGRPGKDQPCLEQQAWWARQQNGLAVYINLEDEGTGDPVFVGQDIAADAIDRIQSAWLPKQTPVWLDIETDNAWRGSTERHRQLIQATAVALAEAGHPVGVYSAPKLWLEITDGVDPGMPIWYAVGLGDRGMAERACQGKGFGGRQPSIVQWIEARPDGTLMDHDLLCEGVDPTGLLLPSGFKG